MLLRYLSTTRNISLINRNISNTFTKSIYLSNLKSFSSLTQSHMSKCWDSWPKELPLSNERIEYPEYHALNCAESLRSLTQYLRTEAISKVNEALKGDVEGVAVVMMGGQSPDFELYCSDTEKVEFRQESYFRHLFQINEPDCYGVLDLNANKSVLYVPQMSEAAARWQGPMRPLTHYVDTYGVDEANTTDNLAQDLKARGIKKVLVLKGVNTDSGCMTKTTAVFDGLDAFEVDYVTLHPILTELRVIKTPFEIELLRKACRMSAKAHTYVMRHIKPGMTEFQCEALFKAFTAYHGGARYMAYTCICGSGAHGSILHYGHAGYPNNRWMVDGDMIVLDMGAEYNGYATDLTRSYPINGKFTPRQKAIHAAVCEAQTAVYAQLRAGVSWQDMHRVSERVIVTHLRDIGILKGSVDELCAAYVASVFMPHGLGHLLGMNVHDVGGYPSGAVRSQEPGLNWLRCGRVLEAGMVVTVEPGIYFNEPWIEAALKNPDTAKYIDADLVRTYYGFGGIRMEDDILITADGYENLAGEWPTTAGEIERVIQQAQQQ